MWDLSSLTRIGPMHPALEVWSVNHWTTREVLEGLFICPVLSCSPRHSPSLNLAAHNLTPWLRWERHEPPWNENRVSWAAGGPGTSSHALLLPYRRNCNWEGLSWNWLYFLGWVDRRVKLILLLSSMCSMFIFFPPVMSWNFSSLLLCSHKDPLIWTPITGNKPERIESPDPNTLLCTRGHSSVIYDSQKVETTQVSSNTWMDY